jgi:uncharacterized protein
MDSMESDDRFVPSLPANVERAIHSLKARLTSRFGSRFAELRLFGSFARGEQHEESDIDVLVLFEEEKWDEVALFDEVAAVDVAERVWISPLILSRRNFERMVAEELGIAQAIEEEGIRV